MTNLYTGVLLIFALAVFFPIIPYVICVILRVLHLLPRKFAEETLEWPYKSRSNQSDINDDLFLREAEIEVEEFLARNGQ